MSIATHPAAVTIPAWTAAVILTADWLQSCSEAYAAWQQEIARFVDLRLAEDQRSLQALMAARDMTDAMKVQHEWGVQAATDYAREAAALGRLANTLSLTGTTPAVQDAARLLA
jgi:hypothetical protein